MLHATCDPVYFYHDLQLKVHFCMFCRNHTAVNGAAHLPGGVGHMSSSSCGSVSCIKIPPAANHARVFHGQNADSYMSCWICFWSCEGNICNSLLSCDRSVPSIWWGTSGFGPIVHVAVEAPWRRKGEDCADGATGTGPPWCVPCSHQGEERVKDGFKADAFWCLQHGC